jgi:hypothetical protein
MGAREKLRDTQWPSLHAMVEAYRAEAVRTARTEYREELDGSAASLDRLERILNRLCPAPEPLPAEDGEWLSMLWGSYFGETLRALHGGDWTMSLYPGSDFAVPTLEVPTDSPKGPSRLYPMMKVHRRLTLGAGEGLPAFYAMVASRLRAAQ